MGLTISLGLTNYWYTFATRLHQRNSAICMVRIFLMAEAVHIGAAVKSVFDESRFSGVGVFPLEFSV